MIRSQLKTDAMRSTPEPQDRPLVIPPKPAPAPAQDRWTPQGGGIERNQDGKLRTNVPLPKVGG